eukprot:222252_1
MRIIDVLSIVMLFNRILNGIKNQLDFESNRFVVTQEEFIKFVDPKSVPNQNETYKITRITKINTTPHAVQSSIQKSVILYQLSDNSDDEFENDQTLNLNWTEKAKVAHNIFQSVLDSVQHFVTLGQVMQTINTLIDDVLDMECGDLTRILNILSNKMKYDNQKCDKLKSYNREDINHFKIDSPISNNNSNHKRGKYEKK